MRRRNITIRQGGVANNHVKFNRVKELLKEKFASDEEINKFVNHIIRSGWDIDDVESFNKQAGNYNRPAVDAFLFNGEHTLDQIMLQQGVYTEFKDTAADPNYAIRHRGQTELILRRLTPGDLLMLNAAQLLNMKDTGRRPAEDQPDYWKHLWYEFYYANIPSEDRYRLSWLRNDLRAAAVSSIEFAERAVAFEGRTVSHLRDTFMDSNSKFYVGVEARYETLRVSNSYRRGYLLAKVDNGEESLAMAALVLACYGIDDYARAALDGLRNLSEGESFTDPYLRHLRSYKEKPLYIKEQADNGDEETKQSSAGEGFSFGSFFGRRP